MVAGQQQRRDAGSGKLHDPLVPFPLEGRRRGAVFVGVTGEDHQVHLFFNGSLDDLIQRFQEIHHPQGKARFRVMAAVVCHINVGIRKVQQFDHGMIITLQGFWPG